MSILLTGIWFILVGINTLNPFMGNVLMGILWIVVGAFLIFEHHGNFKARVS